MLYKGKLTRLKFNGEYIPCELSCEINIEQEVLPTTNSTQGRARSFIRGYYGWTVTMEGNFSINSTDASSAKIIELILNDGTGECELEILANDPDNPPFGLKGTAIPTGFNLSAGNSGNTTNNVSFQGSGELEFDYDIWFRIINAMPITADKPNIVNTTAW